MLRCVHQLVSLPTAQQVVYSGFFFLELCHETAAGNKVDESGETERLNTFVGQKTRPMCQKTLKCLLEVCRVESVGDNSLLVSHYKRNLINC